jgi:hypothetical protein
MIGGGIFSRFTGRFGVAALGFIEMALITLLALDALNADTLCEWRRTCPELCGGVFENKCSGYIS